MFALEDPPPSGLDHASPGGSASTPGSGGGDDREGSPSAGLHRLSANSNHSSTAGTPAGEGIAAIATLRCRHAIVYLPVVRGPLRMHRLSLVQGQNC